MGFWQYVSFKIQLMNFQHNSNKVSLLVFYNPCTDIRYHDSILFFKFNVGKIWQYK